MVISRKVQEKLRTTTSDGRSVVVDIPPRNASKTGDQASSADDDQEPENRTGRWASDEHQRFMVGIEIFPAGPWKKIADVVGTRNERQTMTHAQKYWMKIERHSKGLKRGQSHFQRSDNSSGAPNLNIPVAEGAGDEESAVGGVLAELEPLDFNGHGPVRVSEKEIFLMLFRETIGDAEREC